MTVVPDNDRQRPTIYCVTKSLVFAFCSIHQYFGGVKMDTFSDKIEDASRARIGTSGETAARQAYHFETAWIVRRIRRLISASENRLTMRRHTSGHRCGHERNKKVNKTNNINDIRWTSMRTFKWTKRSGYPGAHDASEQTF